MEQSSSARGGAGTTTSGRGWMVFSLVGIGLWVGLTVRAAMTLDDPSDPGPVLRTFALAGGAFFAAMFGGGAVQMRRSQAHTSHDVYQRLALHPVSAASLRQAARGTRSIGYVYLAFGAVTTGLMLVGIGFGDDELFATLAYTAVGLVVVWAGYAAWAMRRVYQVTDELFAPLGLRVIETPVYVTHGLAGGGHLAGALAYGGERHGRAVEISQTPMAAITAIVGAPPARLPTSPQQMTALTGERPRCWRDVTVTAIDGAVVVHRTGNGAGRWFLHDLLLAESVARP